MKVNKTNLKNDEIDDTIFYRESTPYKNIHAKWNWNSQNDLMKRNNL